MHTRKVLHPGAWSQYHAKLLSGSPLWEIVGSSVIQARRSPDSIQVTKSISEASAPNSKRSSSLLSSPSHHNQNVRMFKKCNHSQTSQLGKLEFCELQSKIQLRMSVVLNCQGFLAPVPLCPWVHLQMLTLDLTVTVLPLPLVPVLFCSYIILNF